MERVIQLASERPVVIFSKSSCCTSHVAKTLLKDLGAKPIVHDLDKDSEGKEREMALVKLEGLTPAVPAVFIGGQLVGSPDRVMSLHLNRSLIPLLISAGAISI